MAETTPTTAPVTAAMTSEIAGKADFGRIRYAQLWEDADVLCAALGSCEGRALLSICSAGDNVLAMLTLDPERVVAVDLSPAQIACLRLRIAAIRRLDHAAFLELMGARPSDRRAPLLEQALQGAPADLAAFWQALEKDVVAYGAGGCGKFENYFRIFRQFVLPLVHSRRTRDRIFEPRDRAGRSAFLENSWNGWRWRLMMRLFFSRVMMGQLGRDARFFDHAEGSVADHVERRIVHAAVDCDPSANPYLHWIIRGHHGLHLPLPWRAEHYDTIRKRLGRIEIVHGPLETVVGSGERFDGFNLSDIFEYMSPEGFEAAYGAILAAANPGARLVYWNMMVPRRVPKAHASRVTRREDLEAAGKANDKAFFYADFVVEEVAEGPPAAQGRRAR